MKTSFFLTAFCLISLSAFLVYSKFDGNMDTTSITIRENDDTYQLDAAYNDGNTTKVLQYINRCIDPNAKPGNGNGSFDIHTQKIDVTTILADKTEFYIKESPGELKIKLDKRKNTYAAYIRVKKMCEGLQDLLGKK